MARSNRFFGLGIYFALLFTPFGILLGTLDLATHQLTIKECLLPKNHPLQADLKELFQDGDMFKSREHVKAAGFEMVKSQRKGVMVARHPVLKGVLIKKFLNSVPQKDQLTNFLKRISGARALQNFIDDNQLKHIVVPQKWLYRLPKTFSESKTGERSYLLIVEEMELCSKSHDCEGNTQKYYDIDEEILREICLVVYNFRGLDSVRENLPFTAQNQVAFIDTEKWEEQRKGYLSRLKKYLSERSLKFASTLFQELELQDARQIENH